MVAVNCVANTKIGNNKYVRKWDKKQFCPFCLKPVAKLPRHMETVHKAEPEVEEVMRLPLKSSIRRQRPEKLLRLGNYKHNTQVLQTKSGMLVTTRRPSKPCSADDFVPCEYCFAFFLQRDLWKHVKVCKHRPNDESRKRRSRSIGIMLLPNASNASPGLQKEVLSRMNAGKVATAVRNDSLIVSYGNNLHFQHGHAAQRIQYISQKLRLLGRLLIAVRKINHNIHRLADCLNPSNFDAVIAAVKSVSGFDETTHLYNVPSLPLKLGHSLHDCANILRAEAIKRNDKESLSHADHFVELYKMQWSKKVSTHALRTMTGRKMHQPQTLSLASDLQKMHAYLLTSAQNASAKLQEDQSVNEWLLLARTTLAQIVLFNRRRGGEAQRLLCDNYNHRSRNTNEDVARGLSILERKLINKFVKINVVGKRGRTVPILLTSSLQSQLEQLMKSRNAVGIPATNKYVFAQPNSDSCLRSSDCLRLFVKLSGAEQPSLLTSTRLRKHIATMSQIMNLKKNELDMLANFLGHDLFVHRSYYRLPQDSLEMAKVSKILLAMENGDVQKFKGKSLDEIQLYSGMSFKTIICHDKMVPLNCSSMSRTT